MSAVARLSRAGVWHTVTPRYDTAGRSIALTDCGREVEAEAVTDGEHLASPPQNSRETPHRITHYTHVRAGLTWHCRCGATGTSAWDDQARRDGRDHEDGGGRA